MWCACDRSGGGCDLCSVCDRCCGCELCSGCGVHVTGLVVGVTCVVCVTGVVGV